MYAVASIAAASNWKASGFDSAFTFVLIVACALGVNVKPASVMKFVETFVKQFDAAFTRWLDQTSNPLLRFIIGVFHLALLCGMFFAVIGVALFVGVLLPYNLFEKVLHLILGS